MQEQVVSASSQIPLPAVQVWNSSQLENLNLIDMRLQPASMFQWGEIHIKLNLGLIKNNVRPQLFIPVPQEAEICTKPDVQYSKLTNSRLCTFFLGHPRKFLAHSPVPWNSVFGNSAPPSPRRGGFGAGQPDAKWNDTGRKFIFFSVHKAQYPQHGKQVSSCCFNLS